MAKWHGVIGYAILVETRPGVWDEQIEERKHSGDVMRHTFRHSPNSDSTNDEITIDSQISIMADPFASKNFHLMKYIEFMGAKWKITSVDPSFPRLILTVGGVYNGKQA